MINIFIAFPEPRGLLSFGNTQLLFLPSDVTQLPLPEYFRDLHIPTDILPVDGNINIRRNVGKSLTIDAVNPIKPRLYIIRLLFIYLYYIL